MGRPELKLTLGDTLDECIARRVVRISFHPNGSVQEVVFGPPKTEASKKKDADPRAAKREHYELLLGRSVTNAELDNLPGDA